MAFLFQSDNPVNSDNITDNPQELLVFGYQCKLFRDDAKAKSIDAGKHLIPWMGDDRLKIDRYDGRGHLFDLKKYDADNKDNWGELSAEEKRIEKLCEEERYLELHTDIAEKAIQEEEELKRLTQELAETNGYQAVSFSYDEPTTSNEVPEASETPSDEDEEDMQFIPPPELCLPVSMIYPQGTKENALIEKTAKFVGTHGGQMEIMIKTKQASNPQFAFLNFEHPLNPYYKHQVFMIKSGRYNPELHNKHNTKTATPQQQSDDSDDDGYLHPSLLAKSTASSQPAFTSTIIAPQLTQSQLEDTAYGRLLKKLADNNPSLTNSPQRVATPTHSDTDNSQTYMDYQQTYGHEYASNDTSTDPSQGYGYVNSANYSQYSQQLPGATTSATAYNYYGQYTQRPASPTADVKPLIERLLTYVKKDGQAFEDQVLQKKDERFSFLQPQDKDHQYYLWRKNELLATKSVLNSKNKAVSFSIKQKEMEPSSIDTSKRAALPCDPESDEEATPSNVTSQVEKAAVISVPAPSVIPSTQSSTGNTDTDRSAAAPPNEESLQKKIAEQKLRDKLAAAMREKMTQVTANTKEKSLQAERKRKAAMFVNMLKSKHKDKISSAPIGPELPPSTSYVDNKSESRLRPDPVVQDYNHGRTKSSSSSRHRSDRDRHSNDRNRDRDRHRDRHRRKRSHSPSKHRRSTESMVDRTVLRSIVDKHGESCKSGTSTPTSTDYSAKQTQQHDEEYLAKVKKMLKVSRREVYKEDLFGD